MQDEALFTPAGEALLGHDRPVLQSWGNKALGLSLIGEATGQPIGFFMAFVRDVCHILDSLTCYIGWLWPLWDAKRQTFADKIIHTVVINV